MKKQMVSFLIVIAMITCVAGGYISTQFTYGAAKNSTEKEYKNKDMGVTFKMSKELYDASYVTYKGKSYDSDIKKNCKKIIVTGKKDGVTAGLFTVYSFSGKISPKTIEKKSPMMSYLGYKNKRTYTIKKNEFSTKKARQKFSAIMNKYVSGIDKKIVLTSDNTAAKKAYKKYLKSAKVNKSSYYAIKNVSRDYSSVLLLTKDYYKDGKNTFAIDAKVYKYYSGKVRYICTISSTGTAYPICVKGRNLLTGYHHCSTKTIVDGNSAYATTASGLYMNKDFKDAFIEKTKITNGKEKVLSHNKVSVKVAEKNNYYLTNGNYAGKTLKFKKIK